MAGPPKEAACESYATLAPKRFGDLGSEERCAVYSVLRLRVEALPDGALKVSGAFGEETLVWETVGTSTR